MKTTIFTEQLDLTEAQVDGRVLRNVVLIRAGTSANRRHYSEDVLLKSVGVFEGVKAYDGHERRARKVAETTGWYANVRYENGALRADRYFTGTQAGRDVQSIAEDIVSGVAPKSLAGLSINATGTGKAQKLPDGDALVVEAITAAESVDDVATPAAGGGYTEQKSDDALAQALIESMTFEEFFASRPDYIERIQREMKTIRQDEAVKAAKTEADHNRTALTELQAQLEEAHAAREAAERERDTARRALAVERVLSDPKVKLPVSWKDELRVKLSEADPEQWGGLVESYQKLAISAGHKPRVEVTGAGHQENDPVQVQESVSPLIRADEGLNDWLARLATQQS